MRSLSPRGATGKPYVRYWMHNGFINIDNEEDEQV